MTKNEAIEFEKQLKDFISIEARDMDISSESLDDLIDKCIEIYPDEILHMGMFDLGNESTSIRPGNVRFNQRDFYIACASLAASAAYPNSKWGYFVIGLNCLIFANSAADTVTKKITENEAYIVAFLHTHNMYNHGLEEDLFDNEFNNWYHNETGDDMSMQRIHKALKNLYNMKSIAIVNGEIRLLETVWRNRLTS